MPTKNSKLIHLTTESGLDGHCQMVVDQGWVCLVARSAKRVATSIVEAAFSSLPDVDLSDRKIVEHQVSTGRNGKALRTFSEPMV